LPKDNEKDLEDIPEAVKRDVKFVFATRLHEVLGVAMKSWPPKSVSKPQKAVPFPTLLAAN